jgi:hypothetical protein
LRNHEGIRVCGLDTFESEVRDRLLVCRDVDRANFVSGVDKSGTAASPFEKLKRAAPDDECLGFVGPFRGLVDDTHRDAIARKLDCRGQSDGAGSCNEYVQGHTELLVKRIFLLYGRAALTRVVKQWQRRGHSKSQEKPNDLAKALLSFFLGFIAQSALLGEVDPKTITRGMEGLLA